MNSFIKLKQEEVDQWKRYLTLKNTYLRWNTQSLASYEAAELNHKRLMHLESMDKFDTVESKIQYVLRYPFLMAYSDNLKKYTEEKFKAESILEELLELKNSLNI